ncbi:MAG: tRNA lysidine(34) synthetase TilS [Bacteriovoracaceae bacterium]
MRKNGSVNLDFAPGKISDLYCLKFVKQVQKFFNHLKLLPPSGKLLVAVSGGIDSMSLLCTLYLLKKQKYIKEIKVIYINHGTRKENDDEMRFIREISQSLEVEFFTEKVTGLNLNMANFEAVARELRYQVFKKYLRAFPDYYLALAHHLDDSYEWSFMMSKKSGNLSATLGIPVRNGRVVRPFLSVSKKQILTFAKRLKIPYIQDSSNADRKFERNFVRLALLPVITKKYPHLLKNYVYQSNDLAFKLNRHRIQKFLPPSKLLQYHFSGVTFLFRQDLLKQLDGYEMELMHVIKKLSNKKRGLLRKEVEKLITAFAAGKKGPMSFSGAVKCYMLGPFLMFINENGQDWLNQKDRELALKIVNRDFNFEQLSLYDVIATLQKTETKTFPILALGTSQKERKSSTTLESLFPKTTYVLKTDFAENYFWILENCKTELRQNGTKNFTIFSIS